MSRFVNYVTILFMLLRTW